MERGEEENTNTFLVSLTKTKKEKRERAHERPNEERKITYIYMRVLKSETKEKKSQVDKALDDEQISLFNVIICFRELKKEEEAKEKKETN